MKLWKSVAALVASVCVAVGLAACGPSDVVSQVAHETGTSGETKSKGNSKDGQSTTSNAKSMPNWRETYHCAEPGEYKSVPDVDPNHHVFNYYLLASKFKNEEEEKGAACVIITDQQTVNVPVILISKYNKPAASDDKFVGEIAVRFDSPDVGSWTVTADATKINAKDVVIGNNSKNEKAFNLGIVTCQSGKCGTEWDDFVKFGNKGSKSEDGGMTAIASIGGDTIHRILVIRRG